MAYLLSSFEAEIDDKPKQIEAELQNRVAYKQMCSMLFRRLASTDKIFQKNNYYLISI